MEPFARIVYGYHGCTEAAQKLLLGKLPISDWRPSANDWDWLGHGIYFWEHAAERALRWARERFRRPRQRPAVVGAHVQLGRCFDLLNESITSLLTETYAKLARTFEEQEKPLPQNRGPEGKRRELDCFVINSCLDDLQEQGIGQVPPGSLQRKLRGKLRVSSFFTLLAKKEVTPTSPISRSQGQVATEIFQVDIGNLGVGKIETSQYLQAPEVFYAVIGHLGVRERERLQGR